MYETLEISEFRGIKHAKFADLGQINVLVGRNNSGKTAFLEAAYLLSAGRTGFVDALGDNAMRKVVAETRPDAGWDYLIKQKSTAAVVTASLAGSRQDRLSIAKTPNELRPVPNSDLLSKVTFSTNGSLKQFKEKIIDEDLFFHFSGDGDVLGELYTVGSAIGISTAGMENDADAAPSGLFVAGLYDLESKLYDKVAKIGGIRDVIEWIKTAMPGTTDVRKISGCLHVMRENEDPAPLAIMGDGLRLSLTLMMAANLVKGGILAIEEPENRLHPGLMLSVVDELARKCIDNDTQIFFSTHSLEFLQYALRWAPPEAKMSVFRISNLDGDTLVEHYDRQHATECIDDVRLDLRGM